MASAAPLVGDLVELKANPSAENAQGLYVVRSASAGSYKVSRPDTPQHQITVQLTDIVSAYRSSDNPPNAYIPPGGFPKWTAALAKALAGTGTATLMALGASLAPLGGGGTAISDMLTKPYGALYRQRLINAGYPVHGDTFLPTASAGYNSLVTYSVAPWTMDVTPAAWQFNGPFTLPIWATQTTMPLLHATHPSAALGYNARSASVWYFDVGNQDGATSTVGRTWSANANGSGTQNVTELGDHLLHRLDFTNLPNQANNVINIGNQGSALFCMFIVAISWFPTTTIPTTGVHFSWFGMPGSCSLNDLMRKDGTAPKLRIERLLAPSNTPTGDPPSVPFVANTAFSPPFQPDMVWMEEFDDFAFVGLPTASGSNPSYTVTGASPSAYAQGMGRLLRVLRKSADVIHFFPAIPDGYVSDVTIGSAQQWNIEEYYVIRKQLAELHGQGWLNIDNEIGETGLASKYLVAANPHLTDKGQAFVDSLNQSRLGQ